VEELRGALSIVALLLLVKVQRDKGSSAQSQARQVVVPSNAQRAEDSLAIGARTVIKRGSQRGLGGVVVVNKQTQVAPAIEGHLLLPRHLLSEFWQLLTF
jgi:hypothetical protein